MNNPKSNQKQTKAIRGLLSDQNKQLEHSKGYLTFLWRKILLERGISISNWERLLNAYLNRPKGGKRREGKDRSSDRNNLCKELVRPNFTWNVLMKGIRILNPISVKITFEFTWPFQQTSKHSIVIKVSDIDEVENQEDNKETPDA
jgi:hypothetical protein